MGEHTNKDMLVKGLRTMGITLALMFIGPSVVYIALSNKEKPLYIPLLILGFLICACAIYFGFKGIKIVMDSLFEKPSSNSN